MTGSANASSSSVAQPETPPDIREQMQLLIQQGSIPATSVDQRRRNKRARGAEYGVPPELSTALQYSYLHPNLPPPRGMRWKMLGHRKFALAPKGG